jgi:endonuclease-3 related protein
MIRWAKNEAQVRAFYRALTQAWGPQHWWPARTRFEVIVGAYLTQNTAWTNVERALTSLRQAGLLTVTGIRRVPLADLERLVRSAGYFRQKAQSLKTFVAFLAARYGGSLNRMFAQHTMQLRKELLELNGVGPETADSILLYAGNHPVFVVDTYTRRVLERHQLLPANPEYEDIRQLFEQALIRVAEAKPQSRGRIDAGGPAAAASRSAELMGARHAPSRQSTAKRAPLVQVYNEMHAFLVGVGKRHCLKAEPRCEGCPLCVFLTAGEKNSKPTTETQRHREERTQPGLSSRTK